MSESILNSTKKMLGIDADYDAFDMDVILHINGALSTLNQLGLGPEEGFMIEDETAEWGDLLEDDMRLNSVKSLIYLKVRLVFDPPSTSFALTAMQEQIKELEWRLSVYREGRDRA
ncbi:hypothetical protein PBI_UNTOUCHABLE_14 [Gordonia phage Untouchable]|uniref:Head-to-tail connector complex protein n=2 Tax=Kenoshavirus TaxID=2842796 RepID=A0A649VAA3_9CAUD|nr:virion structural protein [Gordonia phage Untouchable]YP_009853877.1 virion structural protein [Gordonia phage Crocheter]QGJ89059.1 hypothetical protein PBI_UNTOUCHABLE_14 [Gordonia phage Untouchable]QGJ90360.1 hypothetical protein PBI_CROCHETER_14 [Gordonia phage Crocheter]